jgi:hypothetical protein
MTKNMVSGFVDEILNTKSRLKRFRAYQLIKFIKIGNFTQQTINLQFTLKKLSSMNFNFPFSNRYTMLAWTKFRMMVTVQGWL